MQTRRNLARDALQGLLALLILWFIMRGDVTRLPHIWIPTEANEGLLASSPAFLAYMMLMYFIEGTRAARRTRENAGSALRQALEPYVSFWKVGVPLILVGYFVFDSVKDWPIFTPAFEEPSVAKSLLTLAALSNGIHEGAWLVSSLAICALCAALYEPVLKKRGRWVALLVPAAGFVVECLLCRFVLVFDHFKVVFPLSAMAGTGCFMMGFLLFRNREGLENRLTAASDAIEGNRAARWATAPFRYVGENRVAFWTLQFFVVFYYYSLPASVYRRTLSYPVSYLIFVCLLMFGIFGFNWMYTQLELAVKRSKRSVLAIPLMLAVPFLLHFCLEASSDYGVYTANTVKQWPHYTVIAAIGIMCLIMMLRALTGRWHVAGIIVSVLITVIGLVNYYTMMFHGTLLTVEDLKNIETAANVAGGYDFSLDATSWKVLLIGLGAVLCCLAAWWLSRAACPAFSRKRRWTSRLLCALLSFGVFFLLYFAKSSVVAKTNNIWNWVILYSKIGYFSGTVESTRANFAFTVREPAAYSDERIAELAQKATEEAMDEQEVAAATEQGLPDIILILNETWYNLDDFMQTNADVDYLANYNALQGAIKGRVEVPLNGGGTNSTEYEALTGNSSSLINAYSPYNRLDFTDQIAITTYLKQFGYTSMAAHPLFAPNYLRGLRWRQLEFDETHFIDDFVDREYYGYRTGSFDRCTDISAFRNFARFCEELPEDKPRFGFLITIQNHGNWKGNPPELALVHSQFETEDPSLIDQVNEFLSCMKLTDDAIALMQQYYTELYEQTGRRVVLCMFGDHSPKLLPSLRSQSIWEDDVYRGRVEKSTPYFIWTNYPVDLEQLNTAGTEHMDLCCLMPTLLDVAGVPLSYYYRHILDMREDISVFTNVGAGFGSKESDTIFCDREGALHDIEEGGPLAEQVIDYYCMEYNLSAKGKDREEALFWPTGRPPETAQ